MILYPSFLMVPDDSLENARRRLLEREPFTLHSVADCWNPNCESCNQWKRWAREVTTLEQEITERSNKKA